MIELLASVLAASVVGSLHCAGMCGGIAVLCSGGPQRSAGGSGRSGDAAQSVALTHRGSTLLRAAGAGSAALCYHGGRLASYAGAGAIAGAAGAALALGGSLAGVQRIAAIAAGVAVALAGAISRLRQGGVTIRLPGGGARMVPLLTALHRAAMRHGPAGRSFILGVGSVLLPCGWLWAFLAVAAGTGSAAWGAAAMASFWMGTVPILVLLGAGVQRLSGAWRGRLAALASIAMVAVGVHTAVRAHARADALAGAGWHPATDAAAAASRVTQASRETPSCCEGEAP